MRAGDMDFEIIDGVEEAEDTRCEARPVTGRVSGLNLAGVDGGSIQENHIELEEPALADKPQGHREGVP